MSTLGFKRDWAVSGRLALAGVFFLASQGVIAAEKTSYSPKLGIRLGAGLLQNQGGTGASPGYRGFDVYFSYYFNGGSALGIGYLVDPPFGGFRGFGRYYFRGQGTRSVIRHELVSSERQDLYAFYAGGELTQRSYSYSLKKADGSRETIQGNSGSVQAAIGLDRKVAARLDFNVEASLGLLNLYASDTRVAILPYVLYFGMSYGL